MHTSHRCSSASMGKQQEPTKKVIRRGAVKGKWDRTWWFWDCEICGDRMQYLSEKAMVLGSLDHRDRHMKGAQL